MRKTLRLRGAVAQAGGTVAQCAPRTADHTTSCAGAGHLGAGNATATSGRARLRIPHGARVEWARLYWGGAAPGTADPAVRLAVPGASVRRVRAASGDVYRTVGGYQASADVTKLIAGGGAGTYAVGGIRAAHRARDQAAGGWNLLVVYADRGAPRSAVTVYDGFRPGQTSALRSTGDASPAVASAPARSRVGVLAFGGTATRVIRARRPEGPWATIPGTPVASASPGRVRATMPTWFAPGAGTPLAIDSVGCGCRPAVAYVQTELPGPATRRPAVASAPGPGAADPPRTSAAPGTPDSSGTSDSAGLAVLGASTGPVRSDGAAAYTVTVHNAGPGTARDVTLDSRLGAGIGYDKGPKRTTHQGRMVTTDLGDVHAGSTVTVTIRITVPARSAARATGTSTVRTPNGPPRAAATLQCPSVRRPAGTGRSTRGTAGSTSEHTRAGAYPNATVPSIRPRTVVDDPARRHPVHAPVVAPPRTRSTPRARPAPRTAATVRRGPAEREARPAAEAAASRSPRVRHGSVPGISPRPPSAPPTGSAERTNPPGPPTARPLAIPAPAPSPGAHALGHMLPFTGLPLVLLCGAAGVMLLFGALALQLARRRR